MHLALATQLSIPYAPILSAKGSLFHTHIILLFPSPTSKDSQMMSAAAQYVHYSNEIAHYTKSLAALKTHAKNEHSEASKLLNDRERRKRLIATHAKLDEVELIEEALVEYERRAETLRKAAAGPVNPALNLSNETLV
jgi:hypothetical protein